MSSWAEKGSHVDCRRWEDPRRVGFRRWDEPPPRWWPGANPRLPSGQNPSSCSTWWRPKSTSSCRRRRRSVRWAAGAVGRRGQRASSGSVLGHNSCRVGDLGAGGFHEKGTADGVHSCVGGPLCKSSSDYISHDGRPMLSLYIYARCVGCAPDTLPFFTATLFASAWSLDYK
jgi:hypothetical protein